MENLQVGADTKTDENDKEEKIICEVNVKSGVILQTTEELKLQLEEKSEKDIKNSSNDEKAKENTAFSNVQQILLDVVHNVIENSTKKLNILPEHEDGCNVDDGSDLKLTESVEEMETVGNNNINVQGKKYGVKRTHEEAAFGTALIPAADDSSYVMSLVQEELNAVEKQIDSKEKTRIVDYDSDSSDSGTEEKSSESSSSDSESTSSDSTVDDRIILDKVENEDEKPIVGPPKTKDEILLNDLPPEPLVDIVLADDVQLVHIGWILSTVGCVVVVKAIPKIPAVDADTLLFLDNRKCLGKVFETFGPVQCPFYSIRYNSEDDVTKAAIQPNMNVYFAPEDLDMTKLIFTKEIGRYKGSDASWKHDQEPPNELIEYSDDEEEAKVKAKKKQARKANKQPKQGQADNNSNSAQSEDSAFLNANKRFQANPFPRTWQGRGRGRNIQRNQLRPPPPEVTPEPTPSFSYLPGKFDPPPYIPPPNLGHYMPPPPPSFQIPPHPAMPHGFFPPATHHGNGIPPPPMHHGNGIPPPTMHHGQGPLPTRHHGNFSSQTMHPRQGPVMHSGPGPAMHSGHGVPPPAMHPGQGAPHVMHPGQGAHPSWPFSYPPPRQ